MVRGRRWSADYRTMIIQMAHRKSAGQIVRETGAKLRTVQRIIENYKKSGSISWEKAYKNMSGRGRKLTVVNVAFLQNHLKVIPDLLLDEMKEVIEQEIGVSVHETTIWRALKRSGWSLKNLTKIAKERNAEKRAAYRLKFGLSYTPEQVVFVDESSFDRRTAIRRRGWAPVGERVHRNCFFVRGKRYSMLPAISLDGIIFVRIVEGSFTSSLFKDFIEGLLHHMQPFPAPRSVIIMDNCRIHKDPRIIDLIEMRGMRIEFLPPYSPDFNPIEPSFSAIKAYVRRAGILGREDLEEDGNDDYVYLHLIDAAYRIGPAHAEGYFHHSGYI